MKELKKKYKNITVEFVKVYLNLCVPCQKKMSIPKKGLVVKPILSSAFNSRCQVDLIDMQSQADGDYKFIMVYQDHLTKFVQLRALKTKCAEEVAYHLLEVFTIFGAPHILHRNNGREFANKIIEEVCSMWDELKIVHGKRRHSQSQGSVERANQDIEKMLATWLETNKTSHWSEGIKFIQFMKNRAYHSGISCSPYEALFGFKAKVELKTYLIAGTLTEIRSEEDLEAILADESDDADDGSKHRDNLDVNSTTKDSQLANVEYPGNANSRIEYNACAIVAVNGEDNENGEDKTIGVEEKGTRRRWH
ncbi:KRAB-A domain-containing protein 2-like [Diabrotica undecimpunctata]|uniref:KRAB-A domain-containing protein 2-like n=1 Tax=Diabrotica undecimpunctata TaxID=50387 RepID=UPI003B63D463